MMKGGELHRPDVSNLLYYRYYIDSRSVCFSGIIKPKTLLRILSSLFIYLVHLFKCIVATQMNNSLASFFIFFFLFHFFSSSSTHKKDLGIYLSEQFHNAMLYHKVITT